MFLKLECQGERCGFPYASLGDVIYISPQLKPWRPLPISTSLTIILHTQYEASSQQ